MCVCICVHACAIARARRMRVRYACRAAIISLYLQSGRNTSMPNCSFAARGEGGGGHTQTLECAEVQTCFPRVAFVARRDIVREIHVKRKQHGRIDMDPKPMRSSSSSSVRSGDAVSSSSYKTSGMRRMVRKYVPMAIKYVSMIIYKTSCMRQMIIKCVSATITYVSTSIQYVSTTTNTCQSSHKTSCMPCVATLSASPP